MIRQALTTLFCSVTFFLIAFVIPVSANDQPAGAPYVCSTWDDAMETARLHAAEDMDAIIDRALADATFNCYFLDNSPPFKVIEVLYEYTAWGVRKGIARVQSPDGTEVYTFATMKFLNQILHQEGA